MSGASALLLSQFAEAWVVMALIAFARIGTATILLPGFGDQAVPARMKIALGVVL